MDTATVQRADASGPARPRSSSAASPNSQRLAGRALPRAVGRGAPPRAHPVQRGRDAGARARAPHAHAGAVRWLRREARAGLQHLPGVGGALAAIRCRANGWGGGAARGCTRAASPSWRITPSWPATSD